MIAPLSNVSQLDISDPTILHPRILCLHGGGTNTRIFKAQCRALEAQLRSHFRLVYAEAPLFPSPPGPDVLPVYRGCGPFRRWLESDPNTTSNGDLIVAALNRAMDEDDAKGARGAWAAVLGFSQGAKVAASWLFKQQQLPLKQDEEEKGPLGQMVNPQRAGFRFGILMAGRGPLLELAPKRRADGGDAKDGFLSLRTIHVHGLHDPGLEAHRQMLRDCCVSGSTRLVEWMGDHRLPIKSRDVKLVVDSIVVTAKELGVLV